MADKFETFFAFTHVEETAWKSGRIRPELTAFVPVPDRTAKV